MNLSGDTITALRTDYGLTQAELALFLGVHCSTACTSIGSACGFRIATRV